MNAHVDQIPTVNKLALSRTAKAKRILALASLYFEIRKIFGNKSSVVECNEDICLVSKANVKALGLPEALASLVWDETKLVGAVDDIKHNRLGHAISKILANFPSLLKYAKDAVIRMDIWNMLVYMQPRLAI